MSIVNGYITRDEAIAYIGLNVAGASIDVLNDLDDLITAVSRDIDAYCDREFFDEPSVPPGVKRACLIQVARLRARSNSPLGLAGGFGEFGAMRVFGGGWDQDAEARLAPLRANPIHIGE